MVPFPTIPPSESFGWKDFFDKLKHFNCVKINNILTQLKCY